MRVVRRVTCLCLWKCPRVLVRWRCRMILPFRCLSRRWRRLRQWFQPHRYRNNQQKHRRFQTRNVHPLQRRFDHGLWSRVPLQTIVHQHLLNQLRRPFKQPRPNPLRQHNPWLVRPAARSSRLRVCPVRVSPCLLSTCSTKCVGKNCKRVKKSANWLEGRVWSISRVRCPTYTVLLPFPSPLTHVYRRARRTSRKC